MVIKEKTVISVNDVNALTKKDINLWNRLTKELCFLGDNNYRARILYDYIKRNYK